MAATKSRDIQAVFGRYSSKLFENAVHGPGRALAQAAEYAFQAFLLCFSATVQVQIALQKYLKNTRPFRGQAGREISISRRLSPAAPVSQ